MTVEQTGASSHSVEGWHDINWRAASHNVRRLQARIVKATKEGKWGKVKALQRLLTHSLSGKALAVRRVTENKGSATPGTDKILWDTPEKKAQAIATLKQRGYHPQPLKRVYIPKKKWQETPIRNPDMGCTLPFFPGDVRDSMCSPPGGPEHPIHHHSVTVPYIDENFKCASASTAS